MITLFRNNTGRRPGCITIASGLPGRRWGGRLVLLLTVAGFASAQLMLTPVSTSASASPLEARDAATVRSDFNGDGFGDLAIGVPTDNSVASNAGSVSVIYGSANGLTSVRNQLWTQDSPGMIGSAEADDGFGSSLAAADFDGDGYTDLAVGVPYEDHATEAADGGVAVIYGSSTGLVSTANEFWSQDRLLGTPAEGDRFGFSLAAGNFGHGPGADLAIGVPNDGTGGAVNVVYGVSSGLSATGNQLWSQDSSGMLGVAEAEDRFGYSLVAADFGHGSYVDLVVGVPGENSLSGGVSVVYGATNGLSAAGNQYWDQDSTGIAGVGQFDDQFGETLAAANFGRSSQADLAVGVPHDNVGDEGGVNVIYGGPNGLTSTGNQYWNQDSYGIEDFAEHHDRFGSALAAADFGQGSFADLAVGVPLEDYVATDAGGINVIYGGANGLSATNDQFWTQDSPGVVGTIEQTDSFGAALAGANFGHGTQADIAVGVPLESYSTWFDGGVNVIYGTEQGLNGYQSQFWSRDSPNILGEAEYWGWFGSVLGSAAP